MNIELELILEVDVKLEALFLVTLRHGDVYFLSDSTGYGQDYLLKQCTYNI